MLGGVELMSSVNLGGWLVTEPFIVPALYEAYQNATPQAVDEYTLSQALGSQLQEVMEEHYKTFIVSDLAAGSINSSAFDWPS